MKTKDLIARLQACDPSGEEHVCVKNEDILIIERVPAYYDGPLQVLHVDGEFPRSGALIRTGHKIQITPLPLHEAAEEHWEAGREFMIDTDGFYAELIQEWRKAAFKPIKPT